MQADPKGKTLWEMFLQRIHHGGSNGSGIPFYNPRDVQVGAAMPIAYSNGPEFAGYDFEVREIREYNRRIDGQEYRFVDYVLRGVNNKSFDAADTIDAKVRAVPNLSGAHDALLLRLEDEFAFAEDFLTVVQDQTGIFEITDDDSSAKATFTRINDLKESYVAAVLVVAATTPDGKAVAGKFSPVQIEYWDYWRDADIGGGNTAKEFVFVEMNRESGWFQIWRGREFFS
jgi:hypothetical protein